MAGAKEIRSKIKSVKNTQKITRAMEKVAISKMRRAQVRMTEARPYAEKIRRTIAHLSQANTEVTHPFMAERPVKRVGVLVVSTDRGLCGGLNTNMFRQLTRSIREWRDQGIDAEYAVIGSKGLSFFRRVGGTVVAQNANLGDKPHMEQLLGAIKVLTDAYREGRIDRLYLASTQFVNTMVQRPGVRQVLPVLPDAGVQK
uniref:ATP synthase F1 subunit gamma n=1 Tax=Nevskia sp. TaxID=1929292 RepID=UPI0025CD84F9